MATVWLNKVDCETDNLPGLCMYCGRPTTHRIEKDFHGTLVWVDPLSVFASGDENTRLRIPLCERHQSHWRNRCLLLGGTTFFLVFALIGSFFLVGIDILPGTLVAVVAGEAVLLAWAKGSGLKAIDVYKDNVEVSGVHEDFADAYQLEPEGLEDSLLDSSVREYWNGGATRRRRRSSHRE